jgi:hypothetical protein
VGASGKPGGGFIPWAKQLGCCKEGDDEQDFWRKECEKIYEQ